MLYDVFLSYNKRDGEAVKAIARTLTDRHGLRAFFDDWFLRPGRPWMEALENTLKECKAIAVILGPHGMGRWQQREKEYALDRQQRDSSFAVIPVLLRGADPALGFLQLNTWVDLSDGLTPDRIEVLALALRSELPEGDSAGTVCPYRGLRPFREEDQPFFCGREAFTAKLVEAVSQRKLVAVVGASGSGKSSVVRAGLIPALRARADRRVWDMLTILPQERPLHSLAANLVPLLEPEMSDVGRLRETDKLAAWLISGDIQLHTVIARVLDRQPGTEALLLVIDQWEELYTLCRDDGVRQKFVEQILDASLSRQLGVVLTLRGDFFGHALSDRSLSDRLQGGVVNIGPMTRAELRCAIVEPAAKVNLSFEDGLLERILSDVGEEPGNLPLLEFLLTELWEKKHGQMLLHETYDAIGGVRRAIAERAEQAFAQLPARDKEAARWALVQLVHPGEGTLDTRRRAVLNDLDPDARDVIARLTGERLLVTGRDVQGREVVEVGHEALIREWQRLRAWVEEDREFLKLLHRLEDECLAWRMAGKARDLLLPFGRRLLEAEQLVQARSHAVGLQLREYVEASIAAERERADGERTRQRFHKIAAMVFAAVAVIAVASAFIAVEQKGKAEFNASTAAREKNKAEVTVSVSAEALANLISKVQAKFANGEIGIGLARDFLRTAERFVSGISDLNQSHEIARQQVNLLLTTADLHFLIGDAAQALKAAEAARDVSGKVGDDRLLAKSAMRIGDVMARRCAPKKALENYQEALVLSERLAGRLDSSQEKARALIAGSKLGDVLKLLGDLEGALKQYQRTLDAEQGLASTAPSEERQREVAGMLARIGDVLLEKNETAAALQKYEASLKIREALFKSAPGETSRRINLAATYMRVGDVRQSMGNLAESMAAHQAALGTLDAMSKSDLDNALPQETRAAILARIGDVLLARMDIDHALTSYQRSYEIRKNLSEKDAENRMWLMKLASAMVNLGDIYAVRGNDHDSFVEYDKALMISEKVVSLCPDQDAWQQNLARMNSKSVRCSRNSALRSVHWPNTGERSISLPPDFLSCTLITPVGGKSIRRRKPPSEVLPKPPAAFRDDKAV